MDPLATSEPQEIRDRDAWISALRRQVDTWRRRAWLSLGALFAASLAGLLHMLIAH